MNLWVENERYRESTLSVSDAACEMNIDHDLLVLYLAVVEKTQFLQWRKKLRINDAQKLLLEYPDISITSIGTIVGIPDLSDFRRQFYEVVGCFPKEWRYRHLIKD